MPETQISQSREISKNSLANLKPYKPGQSGNPGGRPKHLTKALDSLLADKKKRYPEQIVEAAIERAIKKSDKALEIVWNRAEGKADDDSSRSDTGPLVVNIIHVGG